jgi:acetyl-CoA acetyltransferase
VYRKTAVAGVGESTYYKRGGAKESEFLLACTAIRRAVEDAGLDVADIDGFVSYRDDRNEPLRLSSALGIRELNFTAQTWGGGGNGCASAVSLADSAVSEGHAEVVVVFRALAQGQFRRFGQASGDARAAGAQAYTAPYGLASAPQMFAMMTMRFMHEHGIGRDALAEIALTSYFHAQRNPRAVRYGTPLTREDYDASRWIAEPFRLFDCCPENDGAAAAVITSVERARDLAKPPVPILAAAQGLEYRGGVGAFNAPRFPSSFHGHAAKKLWERAGVGPQDIDVAQFYENFTGPVLMAISDMGFCAPEELESFVANGNLRWPDGGLPINTSGGNIGEAYIHGFENINEAVRQVRGESTCQIADVELSLSVSGPAAAPGSVVLFCKD